MRNKRVISTIAVVLVLLMVLSLVAGALTNAFADSEAELAELKAERDELVRQMFAQQAVVDELESKHSDVVERKLAMDERNESCRQQIALLEQEIAVYEDLIEQKSIELETAMAKEAEQLEKYRIRVRAMEESGSLSILSIFFGSENLPQLLAAVDDMREIMEQDRRLEQELIAAREAVELAQSELMAYKLAMEEDRSALSEEKALLDRQIAEADTFIAEILDSIDTESELYQAIRMSERAVETQIANMIIALDRKRAAEEAQRQQAMQSVSSGGTVSVGGGQSAQQSSTPAVVGSGNFAWPTGCTYITSVVGNRYHPVSGQWKYHAGMDIGAQYGDTISASDSGMVSLAGVNGGYGNCVIIDHGNGYYTLYGHMSSIAVSEGQAVSKGQTIGYVGSTGVSTGPHLHFEIRNSGGAIDFNGWFGGLSYAPDAGDPNS